MLGILLMFFTLALLDVNTEALHVHHVTWQLLLRCSNVVSFSPDVYPAFWFAEISVIAHSSGSSKLRPQQQIFQTGSTLTPVKAAQSIFRFLWASAFRSVWLLDSHERLTSRWLALRIVYSLNQHGSPDPAENIEREECCSYCSPPDCKPLFSLFTLPVFCTLPCLLVCISLSLIPLQSECSAVNVCRV